MHTQGPKSHNTKTSTEELKKIHYALHQTAQPLTVLQGVLELALLKSESIQEYRQSIETALLQTGRIVDCLNEIRMLANTDALQNQTLRKAAGHV
ncbi:MAG TPA: histidine kinase dimerization/phospho-acceptor domain-containing protein [Terriglobales bacterium]|jgi:signal transduction histidine kinase